MKIETSKVTKLLVTDIKGLDPISIHIDDVAPARGRITITVFDQSWTAFWGAMGDRTLSEFFISCDVHYLAKNLSPRINSTRTSNEIRDWLFSEIIEKRKDDALTKEEARELWDDVDFYAEDDKHWLQHDREAHRLCREIIGEEYYDCFPEEPNPEYEYLCRIITTVRQALKEQTNDPALQ